jgi:hypothetical protein
MKKLAAGCSAFALAFAPIVAEAESTAPRAVIGYETLTPQPNCALPPCFVPYGGTVPTSGGGGGSSGTFTPSGNFSTPLSVSTTSANVQIPTGSPTTIMVSNTGAVGAYVNLGGSGVTATTSGLFIGGGATVPLVVGSNGYLAAITASGSTTLNIAGGTGGVAYGGSTTVLNVNTNITNGDGVSTSTFPAGSPTANILYVWNGSTYDRAKEGAVAGSVMTSPAPATTVLKAGLTNSAVSVKASAGWLLAVNCDNANTGSEILELFNTSSVTLGTTVPTRIIAIQAGGGGSNVPAPINLGGSAIYAAVVTVYNGTLAPSTTLNCSFDIY